MSQLDFTIFFIHFLNIVFTFYLFTHIIIFIIIEKSVNDLSRNKI